MATLLTAIGTAVYQPVRWRLDERGPVETCYAPVATARLSGNIDEVVALVTSGAMANWGTMRAELDAAGIAARAEPMPVGRSAEELWEVFAAVERAIGGRTEAVLDVTHSFRHLPFVLFGTLAYLTSLRGLEVGGIYYGAFEAREGDEAPLWNLGPLLDLADWSHAARVFRETGSTRWLGLVVRKEQKRLAARHGAAAVADRPALAAPMRTLGRLQRALDTLGWTLGAGLPVEASIDAGAALGATRELEELSRHSGESPGMAGAILPVFRTVLPALRETLEPVAILSAAGDRRPLKSHVSLDGDTLARELAIARAYYRWQAYDRALLVLREWIIDRILVASRDPTRWLDYAAARLPTERALNAAVERRMLAVRGGAGAAGRDPTESAVSLWQAVSVRRNAIAHAGKRREWVHAEGEVIGRLLATCEARAADDAFWRVDRPAAEGRLLVMALGLTPGVLFTGRIVLDPDAALVITSADSEDAAREAWSRAAAVMEPRRSAGARLLLLQPPVTDPHRCFSETARVLEWARPHLLAAAAVFASVTGGTSAMQYLVERVADHARRIGIPVERYALVDRRPSDVQRTAPWERGEIIHLDSGDD